jgi:hypothetical protein
MLLIMTFFMVGPFSRKIRICCIDISVLEWGPATGFYERCNDIVAYEYLLKARSVDAEKQPLLGNVHTQQ